LIGLYAKNVNHSGTWLQFDPTLFQARMLANCWILPGEPLPAEQSFCQDILDTIHPVLIAETFQEQLKNNYERKKDEIEKMGYSIGRGTAATLGQQE